ncbi:MAG TPA: inositol monophosphatase family protein [Gammaproteobacteria bacterium]|nr:inositol monophosphatase family protein [Gammaproteobacteria bacterium]
MHPFITIAVRAARAAGNIITRGLNRLDTLQVEAKQTDKDFVSEIDRQSEEEIIKIIRRSYPEHAILAEESGAQGEAEYQWIIDPLDGTTNFLHGFPQFAVSIAVRQRGKLTAGVVYDPIMQELFTAVQGGGAQLNERRIRVSTRHQMNTALLGTGMPFRPDQDLDYYLATLRILMRESAGVRRPGAAALDLSYVAAGRLDGFWEFGLKPWDIAAGALLIQEAGGIISDQHGKGDFLESGNVVCGNPKIHQQMLKLIQGAPKPA